MTRGHLDTLTSLLEHKKNIILYGAPGVGKTYASRRLAYAMMKTRDDSRIEFVQFHANYCYEDFVMGYKPQQGGFALQYGVFYRFCQKASNTPDKPFFFIIDDINQGDIRRIFGELLTLMEAGYRGTSITLGESGMTFSIPSNVYIIGTMSTAGSNGVLTDYALRRRFSFFEMVPEFGSDGFKAYQRAFDNETFNTLIELVRKLNSEIAVDPMLGRGYRIGHSLFCGQTECTEAWMMEIVEYDILPLLNAYWHDRPDRLKYWATKLRRLFYD